MTKTLTVLAAAATIAVASMAPSDAFAQRRGAVGAGILGGLIGGAIIGGAIANSRPAYAYPSYAYPSYAYPSYAYPSYAPMHGYAVHPGYAGAGPVACPGGYWARRPVAFDPYGHPVAWSRPRFFCPY